MFHACWFLLLEDWTHLSMCLGILLADFRVPRSALEMLKSSILSTLSFFFFILKFTFNWHFNKDSYRSTCSFFSSFIFISWRLITLQYCSGFCHTLTWISHGFTCIPYPDPPPTSLSTRSLWDFPVNQARALVSCIQPGLVICFTTDNIHVSMLFSRNIPPSPSPTESKSLFCTSVSLFLFCI